MSTLDLSKILYTSLLQGLGNLPLIEYQFNIPQIGTTLLGSSPGFYIMDHQHFQFEMDLERSDLMISVLFSIRDNNTSLNIIPGSGAAAHAWNMNAAEPSSDPSGSHDDYLTRFSSIRSIFLGGSRNVIYGGVSPGDFDYFNAHIGPFINGSSDSGTVTGDPFLVARCNVVDDRLFFTIDLAETSLGSTADANLPDTKALPAATLRVKIKRYIAPWNLV